jgi:hypothetical protein
MFARISRSWSLAKASGAVLMEDKELLLFPLCSSLALIGVMLGFLLPAFGLAAIDGLTNRDGSLSLAAYALGFAFYFSQYFVIFFFNAGLVGCAMLRLGGATPTFRDGLRMASRRIVPIAGYALIATTVGVVLRLVQERLGIVGRIVIGLIGVVWSIATYLVVPVLVAGDGGPVDAVKHSARLMKKTWGENLIGNAGTGAVFAVISFLVLVAGAGGMMLAAMSHSVAMVVSAVVLTGLALALVFLVHSALSGIYAAALYRYALGKPSKGFDAGAFEGAFAPKA